MKKTYLALLLIHCLVVLVTPIQAALPSRVPNTSLTNLPANPPTFGFTTVNAFGARTFNQPVAMITPPGETNRIFILEKPGIIQVLDLAAGTQTEFLNLFGQVNDAGEGGLLGLAFHPGYFTNRQFFIYYTLTTNTPAGSGFHDRLSRFEISPGNTNLALVSSEQPLITQLDEANNHNGGSLHFGPDGYLYLSTGDEGGGGDNYGNSKFITNDFFCAILRLDVDKRPGSLAPNLHPAVVTNLVGDAYYAIPSDNPFIGATNFNGQTINSNMVRTEFWAVGFRNPWRMSFDFPTGRLYVGDVGQGEREEVDVVTRGGNYGWNYREGKLAYSGTPPTGSVFVDPILDYPRDGTGSSTNIGNSITGGVVYRGNRISQLFGDYVFGDYGSGNVWALTYNGGADATNFRRLTTASGPAAFGTDPSNGDVLIAAINVGQVRRLIYNTTATGAPLPATLAATGAFSDPATLTPHEGILPYDLNVPFWSDNALKRRWFSVPNTNLTLTLNTNSNWSFPTGTVWIKHFDLELTNGVPESRRRLETRLLVKNSGGVYGLTYRWGTNLTNAFLVAEDGTNETFTIHEGASSRQQTWRYPSRGECLTCHTSAGGWGLGFNTAQLNREMDYGGTVTNQLRALSLAGYFSNNIPSPNNLPALAHPTNSAVSLEYRVRSYLAANCVQCHQPGGGALGNWDARISNPLSLSGLVNGPLVNTTTDPANRVIVPGDTVHSMLLSRISLRGSGQMPPLASTILDTNAIALITAWINSDLPSYQTYVQWQIARFGSTDAPKSAPDEDFDGDRSSNHQEYLVGTNPLLATDVWTLSLTASNGLARIGFPRIANRGFDLQGATTVTGPWLSLDLPANRPLPAAVTSLAVVEDSATNTPSKFYRARVFEP
ncbi:MAG: PQQ-dependent sugar dehydrogenase [Opitutaceae bacterium]|nr:PQQ-dependent sugar dehydrogenase [Verrucomicrobiales bacterium]